ICIAPLRHPLLTAKAFVTLDHVSGGRFDFGWGVGWLRDEFEVLGRDFARRGKDMDEILAVWQKLFRDVVTTHSGPRPPRPRRSRSTRSGCRARGGHDWSGAATARSPSTGPPATTAGTAT